MEQDWQFLYNLNRIIKSILLTWCRYAPTVLRKADLGGLSALNMKCGTTRAVSMLGRGQSGFDCNGNQTQIIQPERQY